MSGEDTCPICDRTLDSPDRHLRFGLPDPVLATRRQERTRGTWMSHDTPNGSVMMQVPRVGAFVRVLLPVRLTHGHSLTFGTWLAIDPAQLKAVFDVWWEPEYVDLRLTGWLANAIPPWGMLGAPVETEVRHQDETPYCRRSDDPMLERVLHEEWPHDLVLEAVNQAS